MTTTPVFDGHNDVLLRIAQQSDLEAGARSFVDGNPTWHIDLPRARQGGMVGGLFALFAPIAFDAGSSNEVTLERAQTDMFREIAGLRRVERMSKGVVRICRDAAEIRSTVANGGFAVVLHIEGAESIDADLDSLEVFHAAGLRSIGPVWSRANAFAHGVPLKMNASPDIGPGLTSAGRALVKACDELGIIVDLSHLNEKGFWDVAQVSRKPLVATHSNAYSLCNHARNLTDRQLDAIRDSGGLVGVNYGTGMLREDGTKNVDTALEVIVRHVDHMIEKVGVGGVALGSDFDGTVIPREIGDVAGLPNLVEAFRRHGYDDGTLRRICCENWLDLLERSWGD